MNAEERKAKRRAAAAAGDGRLVLFAIRKIGTRLYLLQRSKLRGNTSQEPAEPGGRHAPRLFTKLSSARKARTAYCSGIWQEKPGYEVNTPNGHEYEGPELAVVAPPTPRRPEDFEIVEFELVETERHA